MSEPTPEPIGEVEFVERPVSKKVTSALALRLAGANLDEICQVVGFASRREAQNAIDKALKEELRSDPRNRDKMRNLANQRLERLLRSVWTKAVDPSNPEHLAAVGKAKELIDRHVKLFGLDAPTEMVVHNPDSGEIEAWVMAVMAKSQPDLIEADIFEAEVLSENPDEDDGGANVPALVG